MDMDRYIGRLLDNRYEILEVIGSGGMSVVYKARCHRLNRLVAVKILKDENLQDEDFRRRFHAESQAVAMLSHPNIVGVYDVSSNEEADYIVMELIDGITLKQYMEKKGVLNWKETLHFATQIAKALEHAHSRGLVHRDIKPHNVMVLKNGSVKVADFGIARIMSQSSTQTKEALGSVHYISPEQAKGGRVDNRSDIYSLGVVMYEMITGRPPYDGDTPVSVAIQHISGGAVHPSTINPNVPKGMEQIILKAMSRDARNRYPTATAMLYDLDEFRKDPDMLFVPEVPKVDVSASDTRVLTGLGGEATTASTMERVQQEKEAQAAAKRRTASPAKRAQTPKNRPSKYEKETTSRSNVASIAIVVCSVVAMIAIIISLVLVINGSTQGQEQAPVNVPQLLGMKWDRLPEYRGIEVICQHREYSNEYEAGRIIAQQPEGGEKKPFGTKVFVTVSLGPAPVPVTMPNLFGKDFQEAKDILDGLELDLVIQIKEEYDDRVPIGQVINTNPKQGVELDQGQNVILEVSLGKEALIVTMPDLLKNGGKDKATAETLLRIRGFTNVTFVPVESLLPENMVVSQSVAAGEEVNADTLIIIEYSNGIPPETTPPETTLPEQPTDPTDPSDPTDPTDPTQPPEPGLVTKTFLLELPVAEAEVSLSIMMGGQLVVVDQIVPAGETQVMVELTGQGQQECILFIDGAYYQTVTVDFDAEE